MLSSNPDGTALGGPLGAVGAIGMVALALWAIVPRWRSVVPRALRGPIIALREVAVLHDLRSMLGGYERWRALHRTTGLFVAAGFLHGVLDATPFGAAPVLRWSYVAVGATGLAFYAYRELLARRFQALQDYEVDGVRAVGQGIVEIAMRPLGRPVEFMPGQFAMVYLEARDGWHRHPFTISSAPQEDVVRVTVKALGDYTSRLEELVEPGMPAVIGGPHGRFTYLKGGERQVWIAGGGALAADHESLRVHLVDTRVEGRLTPERVLAVAGGHPGALEVFMCGPGPMLRSFQAGLRQAGVPARRIHREHFDWR